MRAIARGAVLIIIVMVALLAGCRATYPHDFIDNQTLLDDEGAWVTGGSDFNFTHDGLILDDLALSAPIAFKGDFKCTFKFDIKLPDSDTDYVNFTLFMIDGDANSIGHHAGIVTEYYDLLTARHSIGQGAGPNIWDDRSWGPDGMEDGVNEFTIKRTGDTFSILINGLSTETFTIDSGNMAEYLRPYLYVRRTGFTADAGFYLRNTKMVYEKGNSI